MKNGHEWWKYVYDEFYNCVICPEYQPLKYSTTNRDGYREYKSDPNICAACPTRERCTHSKDCIKMCIRDSFNSERFAAALDYKTPIQYKTELGF